MTRISLVVSDVDGTLLTRDKTLTERAKAAVQQLHDGGIAFTITSSRPTVGMRFLVESLKISLPVGPFNGSAIVGPDMSPIEQRLIPRSAAERSLQVLRDFGVDIWIFTNDQWLTQDPKGQYVPLEMRAIRAEPTAVADFSPYLAFACKIVGSSSDAPLLERCEAVMRETLGSQALAVRSQTYYLDITPPGCDKGTFVRAIARQLSISTDAVATIGDMHNDVPMFKTSGLSIAMGNAGEDVKRQAKRVTASNEEEGFAAAVEMILRESGRL